MENWLVIKILKVLVLYIFQKEFLFNLLKESWEIGLSLFKSVIDSWNLTAHYNCDTICKSVRHYNVVYFLNLLLFSVCGLHAVFTDFLSFFITVIKLRDIMKMFIEDPLLQEYRYNIVQVIRNLCRSRTSHFPVWL